MDSYRLAQKIVDKAKQNASEAGVKGNCIDAYVIGSLKGIIGNMIMDMQSGHTEFRLQMLKKEYGDE